MLYVGSVFLVLSIILVSVLVTVLGVIFVLVLQVWTQALLLRARISLTENGMYLLKLSTERSMQCVELHRHLEETQLSLTNCATRLRS